jgi:hypothetical protein
MTRRSTDWTRRDRPSALHREYGLRDHTDANLPAPNITDVSVDGTQNSQCNPQNDADGEVALDIQVAGAAYAVATGLAANIRVYCAQDITKAIIAATTDGCDVCSISWGADESSWGAAAGDALEQAATAATAAGMVVFAASGDNDSSDRGPTPANVDLPASALADPNIGYEIILYGSSSAVGGTSAVAPLYAGLFASFGTKLGFITPELYLNNAASTISPKATTAPFARVSAPIPAQGLARRSAHRGVVHARRGDSGEADERIAGGKRAAASGDSSDGDVKAPIRRRRLPLQQLLQRRRPQRRRRPRLRRAGSISSRARRGSSNEPARSAPLTAILPARRGRGNRFRYARRFRRWQDKAEPTQR